MDHVRGLKPAGSAAPPRIPAQPQISGGTILLLAAACGLIVANIYYAQPLIGPIAQSLGLPPQAAGLIVTLSQIGYGAGLLFVVPLGDLIENRKLALLHQLQRGCPRRRRLRALRRGVPRLRRRDRPRLGRGADPRAARRASRARGDAGARRRHGVERADARDHAGAPGFELHRRAILLARGVHRSPRRRWPRSPPCCRARCLCARRRRG